MLKSSGSYGTLFELYGCFKSTYQQYRQNGFHDTCRTAKRFMPKKILQISSNRTVTGIENKVQNRLFDNNNRTLP